MGEFKINFLQRRDGCRRTNLISSLLLQILCVQLVIIQSFIHSTSALDTSSCTSPLGMEAFDILDSDVTASSSFDTGNVGPQNARVRVERQGGAWCPKNQITSEAEEWLQIDLHTVHIITATETQGRFGNGQGQEFTEKYIVSYWRPELGKWVRYRDSSGNEILKANINTYLAFKTELSPPIIASKLRFLPYSLHRRTVCMRVEIYGCPFRDGLISYTMSQGSKRGETWNFYDNTYDGVWEGNVLRNGLGLLVDGRGGPDNFKDDYYGHERGKGWVGWKNDSRTMANPVEIIFKFDSVREFSTVHIHSSNQFTKDIQVFSEARIYFSIGGKLYSDEPINFITMEDCIFEDPKNISIKLLHRVGQYVKIELYWAAKWIMISEVTFDSQPAIGNFTDESVLSATLTTSAATLGSIGEDHGQPPGGNHNILQAQSDASDGAVNSRRAASAAEHNNRHHHDLNSNPIGQHGTATTTTTTSTTNNGYEWSTATIVMTAVISSFVAILMVLLFILTALVLRNKLNPNGKMGSSSNSSNNTTPHHHHHLIGTLPYDHCNQLGEFGVGGGGCYLTTPGEIRKYKMTTTLGSGNHVGGGAEYQEPFITSSAGVGAAHQQTKSNNNTTILPVTMTTAPFPGANQTVVAATMKGKMIEYYSCSLVPNTNNLTSANNMDSTNEYEYAVPSELGKLLPTQISPLKSIPNSPAIATRNRAIQNKFRELGISEIPKHRLRMLRKLGDGAFGTVFIGEVESNKNEKKLVAVKHLLRNATEKDKSDFLEEIRLLSSLNDPNVAQVLGVCTEEEPYSVILEFLELGDLCQFLRQNDTLLPSATKKLSSSSLIYLASQIASGMRFLEGRNIVHRDLATRNCVVGQGLLVKISHFATDTDLYASDYYRLDGKMPLPIRWMAWESLFLGKYSTKSDVWSFGITLWEILSYSRHSPYPTMTNQEVLNNLRKLSICKDDDPFEPLPKPNGCPRDIYQLICDTWRRNDDDRPTFWEINSFLTRKSNTSFIPSTMNPIGSSNTNNNNKCISTTMNNSNFNSQQTRPSFPNSLPSSTSTSTTTTTASEQQYVI